jgi:transposase
MACQYVGIDLHRRRWVIVWQTPDGEVVDTVRIDNDPVALSCAVAEGGPDPEVVIEATYGWYWAVDVLEACGATVHLAYPLGVKAFAYRRVKNDVRDARDLADLLRIGRLAEAWIAPPRLRQLRELVRYGAKHVALRSGLKSAGPRRARYGGCRGGDVGSVRQGGHGPAIRHAARHVRGGLHGRDRRHHPVHAAGAVVLLGGADAQASRVR